MSKYKYKVVSKNNGSPLMHPNSRYHVEYIKDSLSVAPYGTVGLFVFKRLVDAQAWIRFMEGKPSISYKWKAAKLYKITNVIDTPKALAETWKIKRVIPDCRAGDARFIRVASPLYQYKQNISSKFLDRFYNIYQLLFLYNMNKKKVPTKNRIGAKKVYDALKDNLTKTTKYYGEVISIDKYVSCYNSLYVID